MYCLARLCRICMTTKENMKSLHSIDIDSVTYHKKLVTCVPELKTENLSDEIFLCDNCCQKLNNLYDFRDLCTKNKSLFEGYISQLKQGTIKREQGELIINLKQVKLSENIDVTMTVPTIQEIKSTVIDSFVFDLSSVDELKPENCVRVDEVTTITHPDDSVSNIEDLSRSSSEIMFFNFDNLDTRTRLEVLENTDGEIKIERGAEDIIDHFENGEETHDLQNSATSEHLEINLELPNVNNIEPINMISNWLDPNCSQDSIIVIKTSVPIQLEPIQTQPKLILCSEQTSINPDPIPMKPKSVEPTQITQKIIVCSEPANTEKTEKKVIDKISVTKKRKILTTSSAECKVLKVEEPKVLTTEQKIVTSDPKIEINDGKILLDNTLKCSDCNKQFRTADRFQRHMATHKIVRPYKCDICQQGFTCNTNLKRHMFLHSEKPNFKCDLCSEKFLSPVNLRNHIVRVHNGQMMYECDVCHEVFNKINDFKAHKRLHTGKKLYECDVCCKNYFSSASLRRHKKEVHEKTVINSVDNSINNVVQSF